MSPKVKFCDGNKKPGTLASPGTRKFLANRTYSRDLYCLKNLVLCTILRQERASTLYKELLMRYTLGVFWYSMIYHSADTFRTSRRIPSSSQLWHSLSTVDSKLIFSTMKTLRNVSFPAIAVTILLLLEMTHVDGKGKLACLVLITSMIAKSPYSPFTVFYAPFMGGGYPERKVHPSK